MTDPKDELGARFENRQPDTDNTNNPSNAGNSGGAEAKPGPDPADDATRDRKQVPMYLPDKKADALNSLYERLDGRSKVAGDGGLEKHKDFMEELADFAIEHEDELATRLGIEYDA